MDAMALLCNLQADGPATLRKLHELGCHSLDDLERVPVFELSNMLGSDAAFAQRFIREGRTLSQRLGTSEPEPEEARVMMPGTAAAETAPAPIGARAPVTGRSDEPLAMRTPRPAELPVLNHRFKPLPSQPAGARLRAGLLEGLDDGWCRDLIGQGVLSIETLIESPGLALARAIGRPFPKLLDLQCLAKRHVEQQRAVATLERNDANEPEVLIPAPAVKSTPSTSVQPAPAQPNYTLFPPRQRIPKHVTPPFSSSETRPQEVEPRASGSDSKHEQQDASIGGPFA